MNEVQIASNIQQAFINSPLLVSLAVFCARWLILALVIVGFFLLAHRRDVARHSVSEAAWSALLALLITTMMAFLAQRQRPFELPFNPLYPINALIPPPLNTSFPSGHTATAFAIAAAFFKAHRRFGLLSFMAAGLIALGRIAVGVHYPSDVLGGLIVGLSSFYLVTYFHARIRQRDIERSAKQHKHT